MKENLSFNSNNQLSSFLQKKRRLIFERRKKFEVLKGFSFQFSDFSYRLISALEEYNKASKSIVHVNEQLLNSVYSQKQYLLFDEEKYDAVYENEEEEEKIIKPLPLRLQFKSELDFNQKNDTQQENLQDNQEYHTENNQIRDDINNQVLMNLSITSKENRNLEITNFQINENDNSFIKKIESPYSSPKIRHNANLLIESKESYERKSISIPISDETESNSLSKILPNKVFSFGEKIVEDTCLVHDKAKELSRISFNSYRTKVRNVRKVPFNSNGNAEKGFIDRISEKINSISELIQEYVRHKQEIETKSSYLVSEYDYMNVEYKPSSCLFIEKTNLKKEENSCNDNKNTDKENENQKENEISIEKNSISNVNQSINFFSSNISCNIHYKSIQFNKNKENEVKTKEDYEIIEDILETISHYTDFTQNTINTAKRGKYLMYNPQFKETVIKYSRENNIDEAVLKFGISRKSLKRWLTYGPERKKGGGRKEKDPDLHRKLYEWYVERVKNGKVTMVQLKEKALELSNSNMFTASKGWLDKFKKKYNIVN